MYETIRPLEFLGSMTPCDHSPGQSGRHAARCLAGVLALLAGGCAEMAPSAASAPSGPSAPLKAYPIFEAADALTKEWLHFHVWKETDWSLAALDGDVVIRAEGKGSSSGLARWIDIDTAICPEVEWSWRVDALPEDADLTKRNTEDVAASILFAFGDPGSLSNPKPVPTIRYVWASAKNKVDEVIDSPYLPATLESIVVESGSEPLGTWVTEKRDLRADYRRAFGQQTPGEIRVVALYTDNDHLEEPTVAYYRDAHVLCTRPPEEDSILGLDAPGSDQ